MGIKPSSYAIVLVVSVVFALLNVSASSTFPQSTSELDVESKCSSIFTTYRTDSVYVFKMNRDCFNFIKNNVYVLVSKGGYGTLSHEAIMQYIKIDFPKSPHKLGPIFIELDPGEEVNLSRLHPEAYISTPLAYSGRYRFIVSLYQVRRYLQNVEVVQLEDILEKVVKPVAKLEELEKQVEKLVINYGVTRLYPEFTVVLDEHPRIMVKLSLVAEELGVEELAELGLAIKKLSNYIEVVVVFEYITLPSEYYELSDGLRVAHENLRHIEFGLLGLMRKTIPCANGYGFSFPRVIVVLLNYTCVFEDLKVQPGDLENFVNEIIAMYKNLPFCGESLEKYPWILSIEIPPAITPKPIVETVPMEVPKDIDSGSRYSWLPWTLIVAFTALGAVVAITIKYGRSSYNKA